MDLFFYQNINYNAQTNNLLLTKIMTIIIIIIIIIIVIMIIIIVIISFSSVFPILNLMIRLIIKCNCKR